MLEKLIDRYCRLLTFFISLCLAAMVIMVFGNVVLRYAFNSGIAVSEELSRWFFIWIVFLGATIAVRERTHMGTDLLVARLPQPLQRLCLIIGYGLMLFVTWLIFSGSLLQTRLNWEVQAPVTGFSQAWVYGSGLVFAVSTGVLLLIDLWKLVSGRLTPAQVLLTPDPNETESGKAGQHDRNEEEHLT